MVLFNANLCVLNEIKVSQLIVIFILQCYSFYPAGDYDYTSYDCECLVVFVQLH